MIKKKVEPIRREIDLTGPQGNAYFLLGTAQKWAKQLEFDPDKVLKEIIHLKLEIYCAIKQIRIIIQVEKLI